MYCQKMLSASGRDPHSVVCTRCLLLRGLTDQDAVTEREERGLAAPPVEGGEVQLQCAVLMRGRCSLGQQVMLPVDPRPVIRQALVVADVRAQGTPTWGSGRHRGLILSVCLTST